MSPELPWEEYVTVKIWHCGCPPSWCIEAVQSALSLYDKKLKDEKDGRQPIFRPNSFMKEEMKMEKL